MFCAKCGKEFEGNFCTGCGNPAKKENGAYMLPSQQLSQPYQNNVTVGSIAKPQKKRRRFIAILAVAIFVIAGSGIYINMQYQQSIQIAEQERIEAEKAEAERLEAERVLREAREQIDGTIQSLAIAYAAQNYDSMAQCFVGGSIPEGVQDVARLIDQFTFGALGKLSGILTDINVEYVYDMTDIDVSGNTATVTAITRYSDRFTSETTSSCTFYMRKVGDSWLIESF